MAAYRSQPSEHADADASCQANPHDSFTPPASPVVSPEGLHVGNNIAPIALEATRTFDSPPSPGKTETSRSVMSTASTSSSAVLASLDSLVLEEEETTPAAPPRVSGHSNEEAGNTTFDDMMKETSYNSDRRKSRPSTPRVPDCAIREDSTYYKLKGLCRGATKFRTDGHWGSIKFTSEYDQGVNATGTGAGDMLRASDGITVPFQYEVTMVGACGSCGYAHSLEDVELDKENKRKSKCFQCHPLFIVVSDTSLSGSGPHLRVRGPLPAAAPLQVPPPAEKQRRNALRLSLVCAGRFLHQRRRCHCLPVAGRSDVPPRSSSTTARPNSRRVSVLRQTARVCAAGIRPTLARDSDARADARKRVQTSSSNRSKRSLPSSW